ncbi:MAG: hypothetical protein JRG76_17080 [Deltaproteobacteria bacterium]|nr:hypothetical protein [Deltaproteobacteria bacterium]
MGSVLRQLRVEILLLAGIAVLAAGVWRTNVSLEAYTAERKVSGDVGPLPDGNALRVLSLGFDRLIADLFWIRTLYYVGDERSHAAGYPAASRLAQLVTDIDPKFQTVYAIMPGALSGLAHDPAAAVELLEKGIQHVEYWKLHFYLGFDYFFWFLDFTRAAEQMEIAASLPGGPPYLPLLASRLYAEAGSPETAMLFIQERLKTAETATAREQLEKRYWDLWITRDLARIDAGIEAWGAENEKPPGDVAALVRAGFLEEAPVDPRGGLYRIETGRAATDLEFEKLEVKGLDVQRERRARGEEITK